MIILNKLRNSIAYRLLFIVLLFSLAVTFFTAGVRLYLDYMDKIISLEKNFDVIEQGQLKSLSGNLWVMDTEQLYAQLQGFLNMDNIKYAKIQYKDRMIVSAGTLQNGQAVHREFPLYYTYDNRQQYIGTLSVTASLKEIYDDILDNMVYRVLYHGIQIFLITLFVFIIFQNMVTRHLIAMADYFKQKTPWEEGKLLTLDGYDSAVSEKDEIGQVAAAINTMSTNMRNAFSDLETELEKRRLAEDELRITNDELLFINRIITTTTTTTGVKGILEKVMNEALSISGLEGGTICMVTPDETLQLAVHRETSEATILDLATNEVKVGECLCGECARDHKPLILRNREEVLKFATREATRGEDIRFHAAFPIITGERCLGVLCVFTRTDRKPAGRSLKLLETVTGQIAISVDNARMFEEISHHTAILEDRVKERTAALKDIQDSLMNIVEDLNIKTEELQKANEKLKEIDSLKSMFIASMSHELRTPLNSIIGFTGIILEGMSGDINERQKDQLQRAYRAAIHLLSLITDVIDISKIEAGKVEVHAEKFNLLDVIDEAIGSLETEINKKGLTVKTVIPQGLNLNTDRKRLHQCVLNYLSNAVKYTEKGLISIEAEESGDMVLIRVADSGIGIKEEDIPRLFQSFIRLDSHLKIPAAGTGLGLYLTKKLASEVLGGTVSAESVYGKGSVFSIMIPKRIDGNNVKKTQASPPLKKGGNNKIDITVS